MLDLKELERKINEALDKETPESLTAWLMSKRTSDIETYIGEGDYVPCNFNFLQESQQIVLAKATHVVSEKDTNAGNIQYAMAA
jgi:hypothetical protein